MTRAGGLSALVLEAALDGLVAVDESGNILAFNQAAGRIFGRDPEQVIGHSLECLFVPDTFVEHQRYIQDYLQGRGRGVVGSIIETEGWHSSGHAVPIEIGLAEARLGDQRLLVASIRDVTRRRQDSQRQRELCELGVRAHRLETLGTLAAGLAHDLGNTLGAMMGYASALHAEAEGRQRAELAQILAMGRRARRLIERVLVTRGPIQPSREVLNLGQVARNVVSLLRHSLPPSIKVKLQLQRAAWVEADGSQLEQCLMNLCLNAREAMPEGGQLLIETRAVELGEEEAGRQRLAPGSYWLLLVQDQGLGMDQATLDRLFQPFRSSKRPHRGLGLTVVRSIVEAHGGGISVESELGQGTRVSIYLPASEVQPTRLAPDPAPQRECQGCRGETILIVEDDQSVARMARRLLEALGYQTLCAGSGEEAVAVYRERGADLVLLDLGLGDISGEQVLGRLRQLDPRARVLISSGFIDSHQEQQLTAEGACGFLPKPYGIEEISNAVQRALSR